MTKREISTAGLPAAAVGMRMCHRHPTSAARTYRARLPFLFLQNNWDILYFPPQLNSDSYARTKSGPSPTRDRAQLGEKVFKSRRVPRPAITTQGANERGRERKDKRDTIRRAWRKRVSLYILFSSSSCCCFLSPFYSVDEGSSNSSNSLLLIAFRATG